MGLTAVATIKLDYVLTDRDRHGNIRYYFRRKKGDKKVRLPDQPGSRDFMAAYDQAMAGVEARKKVEQVRAGTFRAAVEAYYVYAAKRLDASTLSWQRRALNRIANSKTKSGQPRGEAKLAGMTRVHIVEIMDEIDRPSAANHVLKALRSLFKWAIPRGLISHNPARDVERVEYLEKGHHSWTIEEVAQFEAKHPMGSKARLAMALLLYTAGRREDAVRLGPQHIKGGRIKFTQAKNEHRKPVVIDLPVHPALAEAIAAAKVTGRETFLVTAYGRPHSAKAFGSVMRAWCDEAELPHCSAHGLRKAAATRLAEAGATTREIMAVTGHTTLEEVERYTEAAQKPGLADAAMAKLRRSD